MRPSPRPDAILAEDEHNELSCLPSYSLALVLPSLRFPLFDAAPDSLIGSLTPSLG
jgi:hypothetical protein